MTVIAMTREMATRGSEVAAGVAERLGLSVIHHEIVEHEIAERTGMSEGAVHRILEGEASLLERWKLDRQRMSRCTAQEILELAARGNVVIRGWGATHILKSIPQVLCVRICAPMPFREKILMQRRGLKEAALARHAIECSDAAHNGTIERLFGIDWEDPRLYSIVLNTARVPVEDCVEQIVRLAESPAFEETEQSRGALKDELILARVHDAIDERFGSDSLHLGFEAHVSDGTVTLTGATTDEKLIVDAVRLLHRIAGVRRVESRISHVAFVPHGH
jgi:cytidylate kinase